MTTGSSPFDTTQGVFEDRDVLDVEYQPEDLLERDEQISEYATALDPVLHGWSPNNVFIYGKTGTGKTVTTNYMLEWLKRDLRQQRQELTEKYLDDGLAEEVAKRRVDEELPDIKIIRLECQTIESPYQLAISVVNKIRSQDDQIAETGHPTSRVYRWLFEGLNELGGNILIVLDEIDNIGHDETFLYKVARASSDSYNEVEVGDNQVVLDDASLGVVGISNDMTFRDNLSPKIKDSLCEKEIHFPAYDANQLRTILYQRAESAFIDTDTIRDDRTPVDVESSVLGEDAIPLAAAFAAQDKGSARQAIDILREAGDLARQNGDSSVVEQHVREARVRVERGRVEDMVDGIPPAAKYLLYALVLAERDQDTPIQTKSLYQYYKTVCERIDADAQSDRSVRDHLSELDMIGLIKSNKRNDGKAGGIYRTHQIDVPRDDLLEVFQRDTRLPAVVTER